MTRPESQPRHPLALPGDLVPGQLVRVHYQDGRTDWWWAKYADATVQPDEIGIVISRTADRNFENYYIRLLGRLHDVTFAATEFSPCDLATENAALRAQAEAEAGLREAAQAIWDDAAQMPGQLRDRPDYVMHIRCDLLCRLRDALAQAGGES